MARVDKLLELMEKEYGAKPMIYTSEKVYREHFAGKRYRSYHIFVAKYRARPAIRYTLWQHSKTGRIVASRAMWTSTNSKKHSLYDILLPKHRKKKPPKPAGQDRQHVEDRHDSQIVAVKQPIPLDVPWFNPKRSSTKFD